MQRRQFFVFTPGNHSLDQQQAFGRITCQQAWTGYGRKRRCDQCLGVIRQAVLVVGVGPGVVKHVFTVGMVFQVQSAACGQSVAFPQGDKARCPAGLGCGAGAFMHGGQIFVPHEWI